MTFTLLISLISLVSLILLAWLSDFILQLLFKSSESYDEKHTVETQDGAKINLFRYKPEKKQTDQPILFVHGLMANHRNLAFNKQEGMAQYFNEKGYDCWAIDLRGRGKFVVNGQNWSFEEYLNQDIPATIEYILSETNCEKLHWIGHSMGGMLLLAYAGITDAEKKIASGTTIGSPVTLKNPPILKKIATTFLSLPETINAILDPFFKFVFAGIIYSIPWRVWFLLILERKFSLKAFRVVNNVIVTRVNYRVPLQFLRWLGTGQWDSDDSTIDYRENLKNINLPVMSVIGRHDELCPDRETAGFSRIGSEEKKAIVASRKNGFKQNYDHVSLVFAGRARDDIFPNIEKWVSKNT